jgi:uncharacterized membrane protein YgcG
MHACDSRTLLPVGCLWLALIAAAAAAAAVSAAAVSAAAVSAAAVSAAAVSAAVSGRVVKLLHRDSFFLRSTKSEAVHNEAQSEEEVCRGGYLARHSLSGGSGSGGGRGGERASFTTCHDKVTHSGNVHHGPSEDKAICVFVNR